MTIDTTRLADGDHGLNVRADDPLGRRTEASIPLFIFNDATEPPSSAWWGVYFNNMDLTAPRLLRRDAAVDFDWVEGSPDPQDLSKWGIGPVELLAGERIDPGRTKTFSFELIASLAAAEGRAMEAQR